ncbi:hypothetical protein SBC1_36850 (plasmid) [Caballeronia sp. SBC1]|nr:hypothetical protein SBC2_51090 [Caballeronia sp. SBC2]QIN63645.1 hypothetical protein SBC1_36850 [Caballeronia sp. SBC1]
MHAYRPSFSPCRILIGGLAGLMPLVLQALQLA